MFGVHLLQQVQILQLEYPERIKLKHIEEMEHDRFYEGLNPEHQQMLAHKVDGEHLVNYSDMLLSVQKLERWVEVRDPLPPKTVTTTGVNVMCFQMMWNLFSSHKLKGNHTLATCTMTLGNDKLEKIQV